jgi:hypothetical protein
MLLDSDSHRGAVRSLALPNAEEDPAAWDEHTLELLQAGRPVWKELKPLLTQTHVERRIR